jgi:acetyl esterase/lipase
MAPSVFAQNEDETKGQDQKSQASAAPTSSTNNSRLKKMLERFPQADSNKDSVLTLEEAVSFGRKSGFIRDKLANKALPKQKPADIQASTFGKWKVFKDVQYDTKHERNVLDFYQADSETATPVVVYFHGGGFRGGDKGHVTRGGGKLLKKFLETGVSVASCNYPFLKDANYLTIMQHCGRSIQFIRSKPKEWNIDPEYFGAYGVSAGALISEWVAYSPDIAKHDSNDPVDRLSKSLVVAGAHLQPMGTEAALRIMKKGGPPLFVYANSRSSDKVHDPKYSKMIKQQADELGIPAALVGGGQNDIPTPPNDVDPLDLQVRFFVKYLGSLLFDGETFNGWEGNLEVFRIEDGAVVAGSLEGPVVRNEYLCSVKDYADFELRLEVKLLGSPETANAGIQIRSRRVAGSNEMVGYQADMGQHYWGSLYCERRHKVIAAANRPELDKVLKLEGWNDYRILCHGRRIRLWINGYQTVDYTELDESIEQTGVIGLQIHGGPAAQTRYRNIIIRVLN